MPLTTSYQRVVSMGISDKLVQRPLTAAKVKLSPDMPRWAQARGVHVDGEV